VCYTVSTDGSFCRGEANRVGDEYPAASGEEIKKEWNCTQGRIKLFGAPRQ